MAAVLLATALPPAFLSPWPHRKRKWRRRHRNRIMILPQSRNAGFSSPSEPRGVEIRKCMALDGAKFSTGAGLRCSGRAFVGWTSFRMRFACGVIDNALPKPRSLVMSAALQGIDLALVAAQFDMQSSDMPVESAGPFIGEPLLNALGQFLVNSVLDPYVQVATFILVVVVLVSLVEDGGRRGKEKSSLEVVSCSSPFNLFVTKRCPSISSPEAFLPFRRNEVIEGDESRPVYQRKCLFSGDGGVVAIDWPSQLELTGEDGFDNVLLLVPGTTEGSRDVGVEKFVMDAMRLGYFPVVLNPRGCAGSPLITPRVFTAADSDDVRLVIQHIMSAQPRATVMGVGWGFGANMLAKYLGEEGGSAPLMAAVCISNSFDLQETSKHLSSTNGGKFDRAMADGLVRILEANKMLFVGEKKGYDLNKALAAISVCEFEAAISRVASGFKTLEDFYSAASSINHISTVQTPLLFIQGEDVAIPVSIPRQTIKANPFTTGIVAQFPTPTFVSKEKTVKEPGSASRHHWSHTIALEWLAAVELALLKGRHPCLDTISLRSEVENNVNISSSLQSYGQTEDKKRVSSNDKVKSLKVMTEQPTGDGGQEYNEEVAPRPQVNDDAMGQEKVGPVADGYEYGPVPKSGNSRGDNLNEDDSAISDETNGTMVINDAVGQEKSELVDDGAENDTVSKTGETEGKKVDEFDASANSEEQNGAPEEAAPPEEGEPEEGSEAFQMRMAAESIMNVLDITMPGTLSDEKKTEVLTAVGKGETIVTALQEAVPEEVRGSMAAAVSGAVQARGLSFNLVGFGKNMPPPSLPAGLISSIKGKLEAVSSRKETVPVPSPSPASESPPTGTGEPQKQNQDGHEIGNSNSGDHSKESGSSENSKTEDHKAEEHGPLDPQNSKATPSGGASDQGDAHPETSDSKTEKNNDSGAKAKSSEEVEEKDKPNKAKDSSEKEKANPDGAPKDPSNPKEEMAKDPKGELNDLKESTEGKQVGGKNEESTGRKEEADNKGVENKDHHGQEEHIDDKQPVTSKDSNEQGVKEETKPEGAKEENKPEGAKEETKPEGDNGATPGIPDLVTAASTPPSAPPASPPASSPTPPNTGMGPPIDMRMAFEALTGFDDSTQMAVTNVFGVVESMLEQMEKDQKTAGSDSPNGSKEATNDSKEVVNDSKEATSDHKKENNEEKSDGENEKRDKVQKLTRSDSSDDSKRTTADDEDEHDKEERGQGKEQLEKQQKASEPSSPASELTNNHENESNEDESGGAKGTQYKTKSTHNQEDGDAMAAESLDKKLENGNNGQAKKNKSTRRVAVKLETEEQDSVQRPSSKVLTTRRAGSSIFVTSVLNFDAPQTTNSVHAEQNGAASGIAATARDLNGVLPREGSTNGAGPQVQQLTRTNSLSRDVKVTKVVPVKKTMEQLLVDMERESHEEPDKEKETQDTGTVEIEATGIKEAEGPNMVQNMVADALKLEALRRLGVAGIEALGIDLEEEVAKVADAVAETVQKWKKEPGKDGSGSGKLGILESDSIVSTLGSVVSGTSILGGLVPIGVLAGVVLASLGAVYLIVTDHEESKNNNEEMEGDGDDESAKEEEARSEGSSWHEAKESALDVPVLSVNVHAQEDIDESGEGSFDSSEDEKHGSVDTDDSTDDENDESKDPADLSREGRTEDNNNKLMGVMAAAVSGGATLAGMSMANNGTATNDQDNPLTSNEEAGTGQKNPSIVSSFHPLAEKALSVAAPVVPTNEDGEIDHERLVAMLAELGQKGGFFRLIGKVALLWGGLRGAMSLTERLIVFLRINERPLHLRLVGFATMILLLWAPVLVPVLPSLLQKWATKSPSGVADAASVVGLYGAVLILITIWGKRVRGYNKPLLSYGVRLYSWRKLRDLISGLALGCVSVTGLYTANAFLGYLQFDWRALLATNTKFFPRFLPGAAGVTIFTTMKIFRLLGQAVGIGLAIALVEEVLFRSWLQEEIAVDLGFHRAVFLSALAFALIHWSPAAIPGLWFLAVALAGARAKTGRNLAFPIGLHAGLIAANYVINVGGVAKFLPHAPTWFTGAHVGNPLAGALGTAMAAMLAVILYPRTAINPPAVTAPIDSVKEVGA